MRILSAPVSALLAAFAFAAPAPAVSAAREPVVLLLSGGGARGAAHVGVLKVLEAEHVAVDGIIGTSMGALVGGLYASGLSAAEIEQTMLETDWTGIFRDGPDRALESYRRKQDERDYRVHGRLRLAGTKPSLPLGAIEGRRVVEMLRRKTAAVAGVEDFSRLPIPFRAVATDLETGEAVVLERGDLAWALRASMAVPGAFTPVEIDGRHLIDGGISENLAIEIAQRAGPVRILAVDISSPPLPMEELGSAAGVLNQAVTLLMARENERQLARLDASDVLIRPALGSFSSASFGQASEAIRIGEEAAHAAVAELRRLALPPEEYAAWRRGATAASRLENGKIESVLVSAPDTADGRAARRRLERQVGRPVDPQALQREVERARGTGLYESVDLVLVPAGEGDVRAELKLAPRVGGTDALLFGFRLYDDFSGSTDFDLGARWIGRDQARRDLEMRVDLRLGERQAATVDLYRPLGAMHTLFVGAAGGFREEPWALYLGDPISFRLRRRDLFARVDLGAVLGTWGEVRLSVEQDWSRLRPSSDEGLELRELRFDETLGSGRFGFDTFDDATFPGSGAFGRLEVVRVLDSGIEESGLTYGSLLAQQAWTVAGNRLVAGLEVGDVVAGTPGFPRLEGGGLFRLSGFAESELRGSRLALGCVRWARELAGGVVRNPVFVGASLELGTVLPEAAAMSWDDAVLNGSIYLSIDSLLGPIFVYVGMAEEGRRSWGFSLGRQLF